MTDSRNREPASSLTMVKGLSVLEYVASQSRTLGVGEVAAALDMDKSTVSRMLAALRTSGYVRQGRDRRYQLTSKLLVLSRNFIPGEHLRDVARESAVALHREFNEAIHVAAIDAGEIVFVDYLESPLAVRTQLPTVPAPLHSTAIGRAALAHMNELDRRIALRESANAADLPLSKVDTEELRTSLASAERTGYATYTTDDEVTRLAAAIVDETGPIGGISISGPSYRISPRLTEIGDALASTTAFVRG
ncbi:IclR family transcriptional regulator [Demequina aurantiaca]|uniref:IclR family transcriptional regulator n=1 Tax=Demequina aurantiaca TaxID=676200 RepID=UPI000782989D|nr:IclR family transcriptional regulator [Demequina aurantiaca]